jgi:hypothetical protein
MLLLLKRKMAQYRGWDVHAHTSDIRMMLHEWGRIYPGGQKILQESLPKDYIDDAIVNPIVRLDPSLRPVLQKMARRSQQTGGRVFYADADLDGINIWSVLSLCVLLIRDYPDLEGLMIEMLRDAAQTCIQGDSHRLLMFLLVCSRMKD